MLDNLCADQLKTFQKLLVSSIFHTSSGFHPRVTSLTHSFQLSTVSLLTSPSSPAVAILCRLYCRLKHCDQPFEAVKPVVPNFSAISKASSCSIVPSTGMLDSLQTVYHSHKVSLTSEYLLNGTSSYSIACYFRIERGLPLCLSGFFVPVFYRCQIFQQLCAILLWGDSLRSLSSQLSVVNSDIFLLLFPLRLKFSVLFFLLLRHFGRCWTVVWSLLHLAALSRNLASPCCWCCTTNKRIRNDQISSGEFPREETRNNLVCCARALDKLNKYIWFRLCRYDKVPQKTSFPSLLVNIASSVAFKW